MNNPITCCWQPIGAGFAWRIGPNPTSGTVAVSFQQENAAPVVLEVFDLRGRRVRRLRVGSRGVGGGEIVWDGRDARGRPVATGSYLFVLDHASGRESCSRDLDRAPHELDPTLRSALV